MTSRPLRCHVVTIDLFWESFIYQCCRTVDAILQILGRVVVHCLLYDTMCKDFASFLSDQSQTDQLVDSILESMWDFDHIGEEGTVVDDFCRVLLAECQLAIKCALISRQKQVDRNAICEELDQNSRK